jgi:hypothetical protein
MSGTGNPTPAAALKQRKFVKKKEKDGHKYGPQRILVHPFWITAIGKTLTLSVGSGTDFLHPEIENLV